MPDKNVPKNILEEIVAYKVDELMGISDMCRCERCRADVLAYVLNKLPSQYVVSLSGGIYSHFHALDTQAQANITTAVLNAIKKVREAPHHDVR